MNRTEALQQAKDLLQKMKTPGWVLRVWENLGWHFAIENSQGLISVYEDARENVQYYLCMLTDDRGCTGCGSAIWNDEKRHLDPNQAVAETMRLAREKVDSLYSLVRDVECDLKRRGAA